MSKKKITKKQKQKIMMAVGVCLGALLVMSCLILLIFKITGALRENGERKEREKNARRQEYIEKMRPELDVELLTPNENSRPGTPLKKIKGIVVHYTANPGTGAMQNRDYFESRKDAPDEYENKVSSHFIIGLHGEIVQCIPLSEQAYASNERNVDTVSIECCIPDRSGKFNSDTYTSLVRLGGWICAKYDIKEENIIRHYDVTGKLCPKYYVKHPDAWKTLRDRIYSRGRKISEAS